MICVVNKRTHRGPGEYIGRPSPLGNPFVLGRDGTREEVIAKYKAWFEESCDACMLNEFENLVVKARQGDLNLVCWCAPQSCHGNVLKAAIEDLLQCERAEIAAELNANTQ
jgi:hypothetical protein